MYITFEAFLPPAIAALLVTILVHELRCLLRAQAPSAHGSPRVIATSPVSWLTGLVPAITGAAILLLVIWLLAYVGWTAAFLADHWTAQVGSPPGFGSPGLFAWFTILGALVTCVGGWCGLLFLGLAIAIGRRLVWPDAPPWDADDPFSPRHYYP